MKSVFVITIFFASSYAYSMSWVSRQFQSTFKDKNTPVETEGRVEHCTTGTCNETPLKNEPVSFLPVAEGLGSGMQKVLTNLYGNCAAAKPLNHIVTFNDSARRNKRYSIVKSGESVGAGDVRLSGIDDRTIDFGFDRVRAVAPGRPVAGPYAGVVDGGRYCSKTIDIDGDSISPSDSPKMFGNGASGSMINGEFNIFACGSKKYLSTLSPTAKAFKCGLHDSSSPAIALDCAELIGASAIASCKKLHPQQRVDGENIKLGASELYTGALTKNVCMQSPKVSVQAPVSSGDVFVLGSHAIVITEVGLDPFGIEAADGNCNSITSQKFNFSFGQSSSYREIGPVQSTAKAYSNMTWGDGYGVDAFPLNKLVAMAKTMCFEAKKNGGLVNASSERFIENSPKVRQLRHNSANPACSYAPGQCPKSSGSECADYCEV